MRFSYSLKRLDSPRFSAFSRIPMGLSVEAGPRRLGDVPIGDGRIALLPDLHLEAGEVGNLLAHLGEALLNVLPQLVADGAVAALDVDLHRQSSFAGSGCVRAYAAWTGCQRRERW